MVQIKAETVRLYVVEEQEIYRELYKTLLPSRALIELLRVSGNGDAGTLTQAVAELRPDVILLSTKKLGVNVIKEMEQIREH